MTDPNGPQWQPPRPGPHPQQPQSPSPQQYYQPPALPPGYEIRKKRPFYRRVWFWLLTAFVLIIVVIAVAAGQAANDAVNKQHTVVYEVTGTGKANLAYSVLDGAGRWTSKQSDGVPLPWTLTITVKGDFSSFSVTAFNSDLASTSRMSCKVTVDGKVASTDDLTSGGGMLACTGSGYNGR